MVRSKNKIAKKKYVAALAQEQRRKDNQKLVFDYTTVRLTESEIDILSRGETFCPITHEIDLDRLKTDIYQYNRRLRLHEQFRDKQVVEKDIQQRRSRNTVTINRNNRANIRRASIHTTTTTPTTDTTAKQRHLPITYDPLTQNRNLNRYTTCIQEDCLLVIKTEVNLRDNIHRQYRTA